MFMDKDEKAWQMESTGGNGEYLKHGQKAMSRKYLPFTSYPGDPEAPLYEMVAAWTKEFDGEAWAWT